MIYTYQELLEDYLFHHVLSPKSEDNYRMCVERLHRSIKADINNLEYSPLLKWRRRELSNGLSPVSWNTYVRHLKVLFNHGIEHGKLPYQKNPFALLTVKVPKKLTKRLTSEQIELIRKLFDVLRKEEESGKHHAGVFPVWFWKIVFETFYFTGIRRKQLLHIQMKDIDTVGLLLYLRSTGSKTKNERYLPIPDALAPWLEFLICENKRHKFLRDDQAFNVNRHNPMSRRKNLSHPQIAACFRELSRRLGFQVSPHRFRHSLGSALANKPQANLYLIKEILGHSNIQTTMGYVEADMEAMRGVLNQRQTEKPPESLQNRCIA
jgi:integrase